jgi:cytochrome c
MDNIEFTKIAGAVLAALLLIVGTKTLVESKAESAGQKVGYTLPAATAAPAGDKAAAAGAPAAGGDVMTLLAKANAENGKAVFAKCKSCHAVEKGKNAVGPSLWGVVDRAKGSVDGFGYSDAMKAKGGNWTFQDLAAFIANPKGYVAGTKMVFNGLPAAADQADLIAYLASQADTPAALPK